MSASPVSLRRKSQGWPCQVSSKLTMMLLGSTQSSTKSLLSPQESQGHINSSSQGRGSSAPPFPRIRLTSMQARKSLEQHCAQPVARCTARAIHKTRQCTTSSTLACLKGWSTRDGRKRGLLPLTRREAGLSLSGVELGFFYIHSWWYTSNWWKVPTSWNMLFI